MSVAMQKRSFLESMPKPLPQETVVPKKKMDWIGWMCAVAWTVAIVKVLWDMYTKGIWS